MEPPRECPAGSESGMEGTQESGRNPRPPASLTQRGSGSRPGSTPRAVPAGRTRSRPGSKRPGSRRNGTRQPAGPRLDGRLGLRGRSPARGTARVGARLDRDTMMAPRGRPQWPRIAAPATAEKAPGHAQGRQEDDLVHHYVPSLKGDNLMVNAERFRIGDRLAGGGRRREAFWQRSDGPVVRPAWPFSVHPRTGVAVRRPLTPKNGPLPPSCGYLRGACLDANHISSLRRF